jgi:hypothetical protein
MTVARRLDRLVADRDADERRARDALLREAREASRERRFVGDIIGQASEQTAIADRERGDLEIVAHGAGAGAGVPANCHRERLLGELAIELADRGSRGVRAGDRVADRVVGRRRGDAEKRIRRRGGVGDHVRRAPPHSLGDRDPTREQPPGRFGVQLRDGGKLGVKLGGAAGPAGHGGPIVLQRLDAG